MSELCSLPGDSLPDDQQVDVWRGRPVVHPTQISSKPVEGADELVPFGRTFSKSIIALPEPGAEDKKSQRSQRTKLLRKHTNVYEP